jgi:uncharacterized protein (DUF2062 family)
MDWSWLTSYPGVVRSRLRSAFTADYSPQSTGLSFAVALFIIALPNLGLGVLLIGAIGYLIEWANPRALSAAVVVLNPVVKSGVYVASFALGVVILGPVPGIFDGDISLSTGPQVLLRVVVGNVVVATVLALVGYVVAVYSSRAMRRL